MQVSGRKEQAKVSHILFHPMKLHNKGVHACLLRCSTQTWEWGSQRHCGCCQHRERENSRRSDTASPRCASNKDMKQESISSRCSSRLHMQKRGESLPVILTVPVMWAELEAKTDFPQSAPTGDLMIHAHAPRHITAHTNTQKSVWAGGVTRDPSELSRCSTEQNQLHARLVLCSEDSPSVQRLQVDMEQPDRPADKQTCSTRLYFYPKQFLD